jgi:hypothetical protein
MQGIAIPQAAECYSCHATHAAVDRTFVQFYPTLLPIAKAKGTLSAGYKHDESSAADKGGCERIPLSWRRICPMCYSAQVVQMARKLSRQLGIRMDYAEVEQLFFRRIEDPAINVSRGFEANFDEPANDQERRIKAAIDEHRSKTATKIEQDLFSQKTRLVNAERSLKEKETKKAREEVRIATSKIATLSMKLSDIRSSDLKPDDDRIFPFVHAGVIVRKDGQNLLTPMRYHCRPAGKPASCDRQFPGLYNALGAFLTVSCR